MYFLFFKNIKKVDLTVESLYYQMLIDHGLWAYDHPMIVEIYTRMQVSSRSFNPRLGHDCRAQGKGVLNFHCFMRGI